MWFTSDTHFFHKNVIRFCNRPFSSLEEMHEILISNWNNRVRGKEKIFIAGDLSFGNKANTKSILDRLNGYKILVRGNHDGYSTKSYFNIGIDDVIENEFIDLGKGKRVLISHFPYYPTKDDIKKYKQNTDKELDTRYMHKRIFDNGIDFLLHGHVHNSWKINDRQINVGVDVWDYKPISLDQIRNLIIK